MATPPDPITGATEEVLDPLELLHRIVSQIPEPGAHMVRYYGAYSCRGRRPPHPEPAQAGEEAAGTQAATEAALGTQAPDEEDSEHTHARRSSWARLMRKVLEVDPLECPRCGEEMRIIAFMTEAEVVDRILKHIAGSRDPPKDGGES